MLQITAASHNITVLYVAANFIIFLNIVLSSAFIYRVHLDTSNLTPLSCQKTPLLCQKSSSFLTLGPKQYLKDLKIMLKVVFNPMWNSLVIRKYRVIFKENWATYQKSLWAFFKVVLSWALLFISTLGSCELGLTLSPVREKAIIKGSNQFATLGYLSIFKKKYDVKRQIIFVLSNRTAGST